MRSMMYRLISGVLCFAILFGSAPAPALAKDPMCDPKFVNPFNDVEWNCMFPIRMAGSTIIGDNDLAAPDKIRSPLCSCDGGVHV
jgi:conjugal transfer pilus assembly protein TraU